jgi:zinc/manganese transport system permease protein
MSLYEFMGEPFIAYGFMRRALLACLILSLSAGPIGTLLLLRRMSLVGDTLSHAIMPGVAAGFLIAGLSLPAMSLGGFLGGVIVAVLSGLVSRTTILKEDASFAGFYLIALALGVVLVSLHGSSVDLVHILFGTLLSIDGPTLIMVTAVSTGSLVILAVIWRALIVDSLDPSFLRALGGKGGLWHGIFTVLMVANLVAGFQALGTLMSIGLMMLPAAAARFWTRNAGTMALTATCIGAASSVIGLLISYHVDLPAGPMIILTAGLVHIVSLMIGPNGSLRAEYGKGRHLEA